MVGLGFEFNGSTETYSTAGTYTDTVPTGATSVTVKSWGAGGESSDGGAGGHVEGTISVSGGDTINVYVGAHDGGLLHLLLVLRMVVDYLGSSMVPMY